MLLDAARETVAGGARRPPRRGVVHDLGHPGGPARARRSRPRPRAGRATASWRRRSSTRASCTPRTALVGSDARDARRSTGSGRVDLGEVARALSRARRRAAGRCSRRTTRWARASRSTPSAALARERDVPLLVDAAQSVGRETLPHDWSVLTASAHKWGGPAGVGRARRAHRRALALAARPRAPWSTAACPASSTCRRSSRPPPRSRQWSASGVPSRRGCPRSSTGCGRACPSSSPTPCVLGDPVDRLPHLVTFSFLYVDGEALLADLDRAGFAVSSGLVLRRRLAAAVARAGRDGRAHPRQPAGVAARRRGEADVDRFLAGAPRHRRPGPRRARGGRGCDGAPTGRCRRTTRPRRARAPVPAAGDRARPRAAADPTPRARVLLLADDPAAETDVPAWCALRGRVLAWTGDAPDGRGRAYVVSPRPATP